MNNMEVVGQIIGGSVASILIREKSGMKLELGDLLLVEDDDDQSIILQVNDLQYHSQVPQQMRELISGLKLEGYGASLDFMEPELRNYIVAQAKAILQISEGQPRIPKVLPNFFNSLRHLKAEDLKFLSKPDNALYLGSVRSGSKILDSNIYVNAQAALPHHILIPATTGRGKSNLVKVMLWNILDLERFGILVLDPHDEYYGRNETCLKDHPQKENLLYYSPDPPQQGGYTLTINLHSIKPFHFDGIINWTSAQEDALKKYYNQFKKDWILEIVKGKEVHGVDERTLAVLQRRFDNILGIYKDDNENIRSRTPTFSASAGESTVNDIVKALEEGKVVLIDTSRFIGEVELLVGSIITQAIFNNYQKYKSEGILNEKPVIGVVIEEAPRVLSGEVLSQGGNIFTTIAREGRKFNMGLIAITQLVSVIPKTILANMNTKIILGNELAQERAEIIASASQDLSDDNRTIASLDKGEAIVSSIFTKFAVPIHIPLFEEYIQERISREKKSKTQLEFI